jgi:hypothetical protein
VPVGLGDHFDITITFPSIVPIGVDYNSLPGGGPAAPYSHFFWTDGSVQIGLRPPSPGQPVLAGYDILRTGLNDVTVTAYGVGGDQGRMFATIVGGFSLDSVQVCGGNAPFDPNFCEPFYLGVSSSRSPGRWTITDTPEPRTFALAGGGLGLFALLIRRRRFR